MNVEDMSLTPKPFETLALIRACENILVREYAGNQMKTPVHMSIGAEAIAVGVLSAFANAKVFGSYRNHHWYLARTKNPLGFFRELLLRTTSVTGGRGGSMHLLDPENDYYLSSAVVASTLPVAAGYAWSQKMNGKNAPTLAFFGDGATEEGVFFETLNFAKLHALPLIFVCEDNELAIHSERSSRQAYSLKKMVESFSVPYVNGDSADAFAVEQECRRLTDVSGPKFVHWKYHRRLEHVGVGLDYQVGYRETPLNWDQQGDPVVVTGARLMTAGFSQSTIEEIISQQISIAENAFRQASLEPVAQEAETHVFS